MSNYRTSSIFVNDVDGCLFTAIVRRTGATNIFSDGEDGNGHPLSVKVHTPVLSGQIDALSGQSPQISGHPDPLSDPINDLINLLKVEPTADYLSLSQTLGVSEATVKRSLQRLKREGKIQRVGSKKSGHWEVLP